MDGKNTDHRSGPQCDSECIKFEPRQEARRDLGTRWRAQRLIGIVLGRDEFPWVTIKMRYGIKMTRTTFFQHRLTVQMHRSWDMRYDTTYTEIPA
jgi:hypothetical protein